MPDDDVVIEGLYGDYAGKRLTVAPDVAKQAIADGWARDPFGEPVEPKEMTDEDRDKMLVAAAKAGRKLRGEEDADSPKAKKETKSLEADKPSGDYEIRSTMPKSK
jgi:hypothetical protein